jgi:hypothetical protein
LPEHLAGYNAALGVVFGFGTALLWRLTASGLVISWAFACFSMPVGGILADHGGRHAAVMLCGFALFAATLAIAWRRLIRRYQPALTR